MDKFTLYDILSFLLPGVVATAFGEWIWTVCNFHWSVPANSLSSFEQGLVGIAVALFVGLAIHRLTFLLLRWRLYRRIIHPTVETVAARSEELQWQMPALESIARAGFGQGFSGAGVDKLFSKAYHALEATDRINTAKGFQSHYFFLRNVFTLGLLYTPILGALCIWAAFESVSTVHSLLTTLFLDVAMLTVSAAIARFYRQRMVERIFLTFLELETSAEKAGNT